MAGGILVEQDIVEYAVGGEDGRGGIDEGEFAEGCRPFVHGQVHVQHVLAVPGAVVDDLAHP